jgi:hypothetical protein
MKRLRLDLAIAIAIGAMALAAACDTKTTDPTLPTAGTMVVRLTDAPFLADSLRSVDVWVVRVDVRHADVDDVGANSDLTDSSSSAQGWKTIASPNASFNLLSLQNGISTVLGQAKVAGGTYSGLRLVIDPSKSSLTLNNGTVLSSSTTPSVTFPSASRSGIKITLAQPAEVTAGTTTTLLADFNVNDSFVMRGSPIATTGLVFRPVIKADATSPPSNSTSGGVK